MALVRRITREYRITASVRKSTLHFWDCGEQKKPRFLRGFSFVRLNERLVLRRPRHRLVCAA
jgi:hypothetical protein